MRSFLIYIIAAVILILFIPNFARMQEMRNKYRQLKQEALELEAENKRLAAHLERIQKDKVYLEAIAREKMGIVKKGEVVYHIVPKQQE